MNEHLFFYVWLRKTHSLQKYCWQVSKNRWHTVKNQLLLFRLCKHFLWSFSDFCSLFWFIFKNKLCLSTLFSIVCHKNIFKMHFPFLSSNLKKKNLLIYVSVSKCSGAQLSSCQKQTKLKPEDIRLTKHFTLKTCLWWQGMKVLSVCFYTAGIQIKLSVSVTLLATWCPTPRTI